MNVKNLNLTTRWKMQVLGNLQTKLPQRNFATELQKQTTYKRAFLQSKPESS